MATTSEKLRVLHLLPSLGSEAGGMASYMCSAAAALAGSGVALRFAALVPPDEATAARLRAVGALIETRASAGRRPWQLWRWLGTVLRDTDVVHVHGLFNGAEFPP